MTFLELYGTELDRELASSQTTLFTTARRKAAINAGQHEFLERTECLSRQLSLALVDATGEYDLEVAAADFAWLARGGVSIAIVASSGTTYIEGDALESVEVERLDREYPGWRAAAAGTPAKRYIRRDGGKVYFGLYPAPSIATGDTWTALIRYIPVVADMSADVDVPFTFSSTPMQSLRPFHRALVHFAAYDLEKLRKDLARSAAQFQLFEHYVNQWFVKTKPKGGQRVGFAVNYRDRTRGPMPNRYRNVRV